MIHNLHVCFWGCFLWGLIVYLFGLLNKMYIFGQPGSILMASYVGVSGVLVILSWQKAADWPGDGVSVSHSSMIHGHRFDLSFRTVTRKPYFKNKKWHCCFYSRHGSNSLRHMFKKMPPPTIPTDLAVQAEATKPKEKKP